MKLLEIWLFTIITSIILDFKNQFRVIKDFADNGYKVDFKKYLEFCEQMQSNRSKLNRNKSFIPPCFIPVYNIMSVFKKRILYNSNKPIILDQFRSLGFLIPMTSIEQEKYKKNPTSINAVVIMIKSDAVNLNNKNKSDAYIFKLTHIDSNGKSTFYFKEENNVFVLESIEGYLENLNFLDQQAKFNEYIYLHLEKIINEIDKITNEEFAKHIIKISDNKYIIDLDNFIKTTDKIDSDYLFYFDSKKQANNINYQMEETDKKKKSLIKKR